MNFPFRRTAHGPAFELGSKSVEAARPSKMAGTIAAVVVSWLICVPAHADLALLDVTQDNDINFVATVDLTPGTAAAMSRDSMAAADTVPAGGGLGGPGVSANWRVVVSQVAADPDGIFDDVEIRAPNATHNVAPHGPPEIAPSPVLLAGHGLVFRNVIPPAAPTEVTLRRDEIPHGHHFDDIRASVRWFVDVFGVRQHYLQIAMSHTEESLCAISEPPEVACAAWVEVPLGDQCNWAIDADVIDDGSWDPDGHALFCAPSRDTGHGFGVTPTALSCTDECGERNRNFCESLVVPRDVTPATIDVTRPLAIFELANEWVQNWQYIEDVCGIQLGDNCTETWRLRRGIIGIEPDDPDEVIAGEPGYFVGEGISADWAGFMLNLDATQVGPRAYTITYAALDESDNITTDTCRVEVVGGAEAADTDGDGVPDDIDAFPTDPACTRATAPEIDVAFELYRADIDNGRDWVPDSALGLASVSFTGVDEVMYIAHDIRQAEAGGTVVESVTVDPGSGAITGGTWVAGGFNDLVIECPEPAGE